MSSTVGYEIRRARGSEIEEALALRHAVFCLEQGVPKHEELDGHDDEGIHLVASDGERVLATCRLVLTGATTQLSRLAVERSARRRGIATALLAAADGESRGAGVDRIVLHAQTYARRLYENAGYVPRGRVFIEAGIEHVAMEKRL